MKRKRKKTVERCTRQGTIRPVRIDWIKARRKRMGLTLAEAARRAGMSNHIQWHKVESGSITDPKASTLLRIAKALRCNPIELLNWKEWKSRP
jgi:transcriptional regulator with XRE-family HTH domain